MTLADFVRWRVTVEGVTRGAVIDHQIARSGVSRETIYACATGRRPMRQIEKARAVARATRGACSVAELCWEDRR